jgi:hypothetical protein
MPPQPDAAGDEQEESDQREGPPDAIAASPAPTLNRDEHVERHRPRVAPSSVGLQRPHS